MRSMKSHIKPKPLTEIGNQLTADMRAWRKTAALEEFDACDVETYGPNILMDQDTFKRIVICAQANKIKTIEDILKQSSWTREPDIIAKHGGGLLQLILKHYPLPQADENETRTRKIQTCSRCKIEGHNSMFYLFLLAYSQLFGRDQYKLPKIL
jgi:hypothetical protein